MRPALSAFCVALFIAAVLRGALPITMMAGDPQPTTAPAEPITVMLLPFHAIGQGGENTWISQAVDEDLAHDLSRNAAIRVVRPSATQPSSPADGLASARDAKAARLISGSYQVVDDQLRITADVVDVNQTQPSGEVKATGKVRDLFQLEDSLAMQLWHILPKPAQEASAYDFHVTPLEDYVSSQSTPPPVIYEPAQPDVSAAPLSDYPTYDAGYPYSEYGYGYPYGFGVPLFFYGGYGHHGFDHHGGGWHGHSFGSAAVGSAGSRPANVIHPSSPNVIPSAEMHGNNAFVGTSHFGGHR